MLACDFFVTITASFRTLYVFIVLEVGTRRIVHWNVTEHPTAEWTVQQYLVALEFPFGGESDVRRPSGLLRTVGAPRTRRDPPQPSQPH